MFLYKLFENWDSQKFEQHFKDIQKFYRERRDMMLTMVEKHLKGMLISHCFTIILKKVLSLL